MTLPTAQQEPFSSVPPPPIRKTCYQQLLHIQKGTLPLSTFAFAMHDSDFGTYVNLDRAKIKYTVLSAMDQRHLLEMYEGLYGNITAFHSSLEIIKYQRFSLTGQPLRASQNGIVVSAIWPQTQNYTSLRI